MDKFTYKGSNQKIIEKFQLTIYTIYGLNMAVSAIIQRRGEWISLFVLLMLGASWICFAGQYKTYDFRAKFTSIMMQLSIILYAMYVDSIIRVLPIYMLFVVLLGLYGITDVIWYSVVSILVIFGYHGFVLDTIPWSTAYEIFTAVMQVSNVFILQFVVYVWTKRNSEGSTQLLHVIEELGEVERSKDDFLANISHEIRTPLNTICGMSEIVLEEDLPYKIKENVMNIQLAGRDLMAVVSDIVDYSELQSGKIELEQEAYSISSTISDVINMTMAQKNEKKIELIVNCDANIPNALLGDEKKLRRVIMKLVDNAIKFTEEGCVSIWVGYRKESYGINLLVSVKDTGIGMDAASLEKLFTRFSQADTSRNRQVGGVGLGLAISNALVKKMGGAITVRSKPGKGTVVQIAIPQKVLDETPIASLRNNDEVNVATYIDMEQFTMVETRDEYSKLIIHMVEQLRVKCHTCRDFAQLQRIAEKESLTHIFISILEYRANQAEFDAMASTTKVVVILDRVDDNIVTNPRVYKVYKPFHILTIASILNAEAGQTKLEEKFETQNAHVLVVDDNRMNIRVIEGLLASYKIKVTTAVSGHEALEKISTADYDFVFMDHMMPEMDGVETLHHIRYKVGTYFQKVPIIALTANAVAGTREMFLKEGFNDFLEKPVERSVLERVLKRHLPKDKIVYTEDIRYGEQVNRRTIQITDYSSVDEVTAGEELLPGLGQLEMEFGPMGIDVRKGVLYCNGVEGYLTVLQGYCDESDELGALAGKLYEQEDWKNYVIAVHGIKGAMRSIGATPVSEIARKLEFAGKEGRIDYIHEHHPELMEVYHNLFAVLRENKWIKKMMEEQAESKEEQEQVAEGSVLAKEVFDTIVQDMESAMYAWDGEKLLEIVTELQSHSYCTASLKETLAPVKKKIEMSDYVSAVELTMKLKNQLESKER